MRHLDNEDGTLRLRVLFVTLDVAAGTRGAMQCASVRVDVGQAFRFAAAGHELRTVHELGSTEDGQREDDTHRRETGPRTGE